MYQRTAMNSTEISSTLLIIAVTLTVVASRTTVPDNDDDAEGHRSMIVRRAVALPLQQQQSMPHQMALRQRDEEPLTCFEAWLRCRSDVTCRVLIDVFTQACDESVLTCRTMQRLHCHSALTSLQTNVYFRNCVCDPLESDLTECIDVQRRIFSHSCIQRTGPSSTLITKDKAPTADYHAPGPGMVDEPEPVSLEVQQSCIGIKRRCTHPTPSSTPLLSRDVDNEEPAARTSLTGASCMRSLTDYQTYCRDNKRLNQCIATDWLRCQRAIDELRMAAPDLFDCRCPMNRHDLREKCERIQWRLLNNTCLESVPYMTHTTVLPVMTYEELARTVAKRRHMEPRTEDVDSCLRAFTDCHHDADGCRPEAERFVSACVKAWNVSSGGDCGAARTAMCREASRRFYTATVESRSKELNFRLHRALLFCRCIDDIDNDDDDGRGACRTVRGTFQTPVCSAVELPPPDCRDVARRCDLDPGCRIRRQSYVRDCVDAASTCRDRRHEDAASAAERCAEALVELQGSLLTVNCSCSPSSIADGDPDGSGGGRGRGDAEMERRLCESARQGLPLKSTPCTGYDLLHSLNHQTNRKPRVLLTSGGYHVVEAAINDFWFFDRVPHVQSGQHNEAEWTTSERSIPATKPGDQECRQLLADGKMMSILNGPPFTIRVYRLETTPAGSGVSVTAGCSELCDCQSNGSAICRTLPCNEISTSCLHRDTFYVHGSAFSLPDRGRCRCIKAEIVCSKAPQFSAVSKPGLFIHIGYSTAEQLLIEKHSPIAFQTNSIRSKLLLVLNRNSSKQVCGLTLFRSFDSNIIFEIHPLAGDSTHKLELCAPSAVMLNRAINSAESPIVFDPQLSLIKVSQLERVSIHQDPPDSVSSSSSSSVGEPRYTKLALNLSSSRSLQRTSQKYLTAICTVLVIVTMTV